MKCKNCGKILQGNANFCSNCGWDITNGGSKIKTVRFFCKGCNAAMQISTESQIVRCPCCGSTELIIENDDVTIERIRSKTILEHQKQEHKHEIEKTGLENKKEMKFYLVFFCFGLLFFALMSIDLDDLFDGGNIGSIFSWTSSTSTPNAESVWPVTGMAASLPVPSGKNVTILENSENYFEAEIEGQNSNEFRQYVSMCKTNGFNLAIKEKYTTELPNSDFIWVDFSAYNDDGYWLVLNDSFTTEIQLFPPETIFNIDWDVLSLSTKLPTFEGARGVVDSDTDDELEIKLYEMTTNDYIHYQDMCINSGYTIDAKKDNQSFDGYDNIGYRILLSYEKDIKQIYVKVTAPMDMYGINWPKTGIAKSLPKPHSTFGCVSSEHDKSFSVYVGNTSKEEYRAYVDKCIDAGFNIDYERYDESYCATNKKGYEVTIYYQRGQIMYINIEASD